jgi:hypothetical protein
VEPGEAEAGAAEATAPSARPKTAPAARTRRRMDTEMCMPYLHDEFTVIGYREG